MAQIPDPKGGSSRSALLGFLDYLFGNLRAATLLAGISVMIWIADYLHYSRLYLGLMERCSL